MASTKHAVVIVGAGPTGLMLARELALAGVDVGLLERRANQNVVGSRSGGLHSRTIEVLDQRGIAERFISQGQQHPAVHFHVPVDISDFPTRHNYVLGLRQARFERILADLVEALPVTIYRACELTGFAQSEAGVEIALSDGRALLAEFLVGCDGGRSLVRRLANIEFRGWDPTTSWLIAEVQTAVEPTWGFHRNELGMHAIGKGDGGAALVVITEPWLRVGGEPTLEEVRDTLIRAYGTDFGIYSASWTSRFTDTTRQAVVYRDGRVLLAGDAAHVHPPMGGQGLNLGVQDAMNLGWKLAQVVKRTSPDTLLDTYHAERHPVAARVLRNTMACVALRRPDDRTKALGDYVSEFLGMDEPRRKIGAEICGLGIRYELGNGHPLLGRRMPDLDLVTPEGTLRVYAFLHDARPVLINFDVPGRWNTHGWADRVKLIDAKYDGEWKLPVLGAVTPPKAVLVRPDGYVAWVAERSPLKLIEALTLWFGPLAVAT